MPLFSFFRFSVVGCGFWHNNMVCVVPGLCEGICLDDKDDDPKTHELEAMNWLYIIVHCKL